MILRKINAVLGFFATVLLMGHAVSHAIWMISRVSIIKMAESVPWIMTGLVALHAIISIILAVLGHKGAEKGEYKNYPQMNKTTIIQRASGVSLILLIALHVAESVGILQPPPLVFAMLPPIFFAIALMHTAISTSKAFITLGIGNATFIKTADIVIKVICGATLVADIVGFYIYL
ncbi:MAG: hypothetical protein IKU84_01110 [Clostridia bacterium]|nr:hypothetical protein [Clostridia bacterium]